MRFFALLSLAALAAAIPQFEEAGQAVADLQSTSPADADALQMVSSDQVGVGEVINSLADTSPDDAEAAKGLGRREDEDVDEDDDEDVDEDTE